MTPSNPPKRREIKFRAWDKKEKKMFEVMSIDWEDIGSMVKDFENKTHFLDDVILLQYTGLKDKKGKEIYEGDIVESVLIEKEGRFEKIYWRDDLCGWSIPGKDHAKYYEVIGNIYQNKDLLKGLNL